MPKKCVVPNCDHFYRGKNADNTGCTLFLFPRIHKATNQHNVKRLSAWLQNVGNKKMLSLSIQMLTNSCRVCSCHFRSDQFEKSAGRQMLKTKAIPTEFLPANPLPAELVNNFIREKHTFPPSADHEYSRPTSSTDMEIGEKNSLELERKFSSEIHFTDFLSTNSTSPGKAADSIGENDSSDGEKQSPEMFFSRNEVFGKLVTEKLDIMPLNDARKIRLEIIKILNRVLVEPRVSNQFRHYVMEENSLTPRLIIEESAMLISDGTTGLRTWEAATVLAEWCVADPSKIEGKKIVELGCGVGLTGLTILNLTKPKKYTFTDCHFGVLEMLNKNLKYNLRNMNLELGETVDCIELDWSSIDDDPDADWKEPDMVIATDVVYDPDLFPALIRVFARLLKHPDSFGVIGVTVRNEETISTFLNSLSEVDLEWKEEELPTPSVFLEPKVPVRIIIIYKTAESLYLYPTFSQES